MLNRDIDNNDPDRHFSYSKEELLKVVSESKGEEVHSAKSYGIGIDTARDFIDVTVNVIADDKCLSYYRRFDTDWNNVCFAKEWAVAIIETYSSPKVNLHNDDDSINSSFHYCIESTGNYHKIVLYAWTGSPSVVNPSIAGAAKKKTDRLDSFLLATHDMTGIWQTSFLPSLEVEEIRSIIAEREYCSKMAQRISNRINSTLLRYGFTLGRDGSVTKSADIRAIVENLISDNPDYSNINVCTNRIPHSVCLSIREMYQEYDKYIEKEEFYYQESLRLVEQLKWETDDGFLPGKEMIRLLTTCPGIAEKTAVLWLSQIVTPRRFHSSKALAAYCGTDPSLKISADKVVSTKLRGGNSHLHGGLCSAGSNLIRNQKEPFGRWGANIVARSNKWKKGTNAVARKLAIALYYIQKKGEPFSYDKYTMWQEANVIDISIEEFILLTPSFKRYTKILHELKITTTKALVNEYNKCTFVDKKGLGKKFFILVKDFIVNQKAFVKQYEEYKNTHNVNKENINE